MTISTPQILVYRNPGHASLIFFNSRRQSVRKLRPVVLLRSCAGATPN